MNRLEQTPALHPRVVTVAGVVAAVAMFFALAATVLAEPGNDNRAPELEGDCARLRVEAGHKVAAHAYATGVQVYRWTGTAWAFVGPEAVLYHDEGGNGELGTHYAGPTWESASGSKVVAAVVDRCTPDPDAIPWLLLRAVSSEGPGIFHRITYIQRVNTTGGLAPAEPGDVVGELAEVPYTAEYYFYRAH
jgi:hypothetical protein